MPLDPSIPLSALAGMQRVQPYDPLEVQGQIDRNKVYQAQAQKAQQEMQSQQRLQQLAQQYGDDPDELVKQLGSVDPMLAQKLGEQIGQARYAGAQAHLEQTKSAEAEIDSWQRLLQSTDDKTWGAVRNAAVAKIPQLGSVLPPEYSEDAKQKALALGMSAKDWAKSQAEASQLYLDGKHDLSAARLYAAAHTPQQRAIADDLVKQAGLGKFAQMFPDAQTAQQYLEAQQKAAPEKGGQHIEGIYQGKRTFGVFDPNTNTFNVDGKQVSASEFRPIPPASAGGGGGGAGGGGLTTGPGGGLESLATQYRLTKRFPVGVARTISKQDANAAINLAAEQDRLIGRSAAASIQKAAMFQANTAAAKQMAVLGAGTEAAESKALGQIDIIKELSPKVWRTQSTTINNWLVNPTQQFTGNKDAQSLANAILTFSSEYAKIINGSVGSVAGASDSARNDAAKLISNALSHGNLMQQLNLMQKEMALTRVGYDVAQQHIAEQMQGPQIPGQAPPIGSAVPAAVASLLKGQKPGKYTLKDGTKWNVAGDGTVSPVQ